MYLFRFRTAEFMITDMLVIKTAAGVAGNFNYEVDRYMFIQSLYGFLWLA